MTQRIDAHDAQLAKVFLAYEDNKDVYALIDALRSLKLTAPPSLSNNNNSSSSTESANVNAESGGDDDEEEDEGNEEDEEDDGEEADEEDAPDVDEVIKIVIMTLILD